MDRCAMEFIARRWWRRAEVWVIALLLVAGGLVLGFQAAQWSLASSYVAQVSQVRQAYDEALEQRDLRFTNLAKNATETAQTASGDTQAADTASKAFDQATEVGDRANQ